MIGEKCTAKTALGNGRRDYGSASGAQCKNIARRGVPRCRMHLTTADKEVLAALRQARIDEAAK